MRTTTKIGLGAASAALAAGAATVGMVSGTAQAAGDHPIVNATVTQSKAAAQAKVAGKPGWQGVFTYTLPAGAGGVYFHYPCPGNLVARSGLFDPNAAGQAGVRLVAQGPRYDQNYKEWFQTLLWPGGAPAGVTINFDVYCTKPPV